MDRAMFKEAINPRGGERLSLVFYDRMPISAAKVHHSKKIPYVAIPVLLCALVILLTVGGCARAVKPSSPMDNPREHYLAGLKVLEDKDPLKPENEFRRAIALDKKSPYGYAGLATMHLNRKQYSRALRYANRALKNDTKFADAAFIRGRVYFDWKRGGWVEHALAAFSRTLELEPNSGRVFYYLGETCLAAFRFDEAKSYFERAAGVKSDYTDRARQRKELVDRIVEVKPVTEEGRRIALVEKATRADVCRLLSADFRLRDQVNKYRLLRYEAIYRGDEILRILPVDIEERNDIRAIVEVLSLHLPHLNVYPNGYFYPDRPVTRAELAIILQEIMVFLLDDQTLASRYMDVKSPFSDVRPDYYAFNAIMLGVERGILKTGAGSDVFDPEGTIRGIDVLAVLNAFTGYFPVPESEDAR